MRKQISYEIRTFSAFISASARAFIPGFTLTFILFSFFSLPFLFSSASSLFGAENSMTLVVPKDAEHSEMRDAQCRVAEDGTYAEITAYGQKYRWPGPFFLGTWNLADASHVVIDIENESENEVYFSVRLDDEKTQHSSGGFQRRWMIPTKTRLSHEVPLSKNTVPPQLKEHFVGMNGFPGGSDAGAPCDWTQIRRILVFISPQEKPVKFKLYGIHAVSKSSEFQKENRTLADWRNMSPENFFPMIDVYGQFKYEDWPGKIHNDAEFAERAESEQQELAANPRPGNWSRFGGWAEGPKQEATGRFYVKKVGGRWWFVDPDGFLFWSHGSDSVRSGTAHTPVTYREKYFENLPSHDSEFGIFYGKMTRGMKFYADKTPVETYNYGEANLYRKYGPDFRAVYRDIQHRRLASWGMNTIGNWSDPELEAQNRTPFTLTLNASAPLIAGSNGYWGKFPDPFAPEFRENFRKTVEKNVALLRSPYCLGVFTNNEMSWGSSTSLSLAALNSPQEQPAKQAVLEFLRKRYDNSIEKLNAVWKTSYASWDALAVAPEETSGTGNRGNTEKTGITEKPEMKPDLEAFYTIIAEQYFRVIHEELRAADPQALDFGCRFAWTNAQAQAAMAKYVDVMSFNLYRESVADFAPLGEYDMPVIVGEFHFGALDRGMFHTGLRSAENQTDRANKYYAYVSGALRNPRIVGTHWFEYYTEATTGRFDGENYQIGLVDVGDTPYPELIGKVREIGRNMYEIRMKHE